MQTLRVDVSDMTVGIERKGDFIVCDDGRSGDDDLYAICIPDSRRLIAQALCKHPFWLVSEDLA